MVLTTSRSSFWTVGVSENRVLFLIVCLFVFGGGSSNPNAFRKRRFCFHSCKIWESDCPPCPQLQRPCCPFMLRKMYVLLALLPIADNVFIFKKLNLKICNCIVTKRETYLPLPHLAQNANWKPGSFCDQIFNLRSCYPSFVLY